MVVKQIVGWLIDCFSTICGKASSLVNNWLTRNIEFQFQRIVLGNGTWYGVHQLGRIIRKGKAAAKKKNKNQENDNPTSLSGLCSSGDKYEGT